MSKYFKRKETQTSIRGGKGKSPWPEGPKFYWDGPLKTREKGLKMTWKKV